MNSKMVNITHMFAHLSVIVHILVWQLLPSVGYYMLVDLLVAAFWYIRLLEMEHYTPTVKEEETANTIFTFMTLVFPIVFIGSVVGITLLGQFFRKED